MKTNINILVHEALSSSYRSNLYPGQKVKIVKKKDQPTGTLTTGIIKRILTSKPKHTRGIKVELTTGEVGRVQEILS